MSKKPEFDYTMFCYKSFVYKFPCLAETEPCAVAEWLYYMSSAFSGRDGRCRAGGGEGDIRALVAAASGVHITSDDNVRQVKNKLRNRLKAAWMDNDHAVILYIAKGFERGASMKVIDYLGVEWADPYRIDSNVDEIEISDAIEFEVL